MQLWKKERIGNFSLVQEIWNMLKNLLEFCPSPEVWFHSFHRGCEKEEQASKGPELCVDSHLHTLDKLMLAYLLAQ